MDISEQEVWLRAYCAGANGYLARSTFTSEQGADNTGKSLADLAVKSFREKFPKFQFITSQKE